MRMKQKAKSIVTALLLGVLCAVTLSAVITVPDWETARADLLIGMQYETTGLDLDAVPGWLTALVMLHQNFPLDGWAWGPAAAGLAVLLCWVRGQREAKPKRTELVLSIVFGIAEVLGLSICKLGSWAFVFKNPYQLCVGVLCCLLRKNGIYAVVPMLLASAFTVSEKRLRRPVLAVLLAVCIGSFGFDTFTEKVLDIPAGSVGEALSVPMQQTARYIRDYGNEVTDDERTAIEKVLDYDAIAQSYMPELSDGVKQYYKNPGKGDLARYMLVWAKMLLKHPVCYFEATHANSHGYYTITKCRAINDYYTFNNDICMEMSEMNVHYLDKSGYLRYAFVQALSAFEKLPLVGLTTSIGFMAWLTAVLGLWLARCKAKPVLPIFIGLGIFWLTCIASPVNDCMRYFLPVAGCLPLVFCLAAVFSREKSEITV